MPSRCCGVHKGSREEARSCVAVWTLPLKRFKKITFCYCPVFLEHNMPALPRFCKPVLTDQCGSAWQIKYCNFHKSALKSPKTSNFLSYFCYGAGRGCGGLGNRIQGLVSLFYLAMLTNRTFLIHWDGPGKLEEYLEPNQIAWTFPLSSLGQFRKTYWGVSGPQSGYDTNRIESRTQFTNWTSYVDFDAYFGRFDAIGTIFFFAEFLWKNPFLRERARQLGIPSSPYKMLGCAFHFLFKQTRVMKTVLEEARRSLSRHPPLLGIHIRTSDHHFGSKNEFSYRSHNTSSFFICALQQSAFILANTHHSNLTTLQWFLAADNQEVKDMARKNYSNEIISLGFRPMHTEFSSGSAGAKTVVRDVLTDVFLLAESSYLLVTSESTLSNLAAAVGLHTKESIGDGEKCLVNRTSLLKIIQAISN